MNEPRQEVAVAETGGRIYVAGGFRSGGARTNTVEAYNVATGTWSIVAPLPLALDHPTAAVVAGRVYVIGGTSATGSTNVLLEYDAQRNDWGVKAPMLTERSAAAAAVIGERIYVAGGSPAGRAFEVYDTRTDQWATLPSMPTARNHLAAAAIGGRFYAVGGRPPNTLGALEVYDLATNAWSTRMPLPTGRSGIAGAVVRGCLYVFGGEGNAANPAGVFAQNEVFDPRTNSWDTLAPMPTPRHGIGAAVISDRIYIPGGAGVQGFGVSGAHEIFSVPSSKTCE